MNNRELVRNHLKAAEDTLLAAFSMAQDGKTSAETTYPVGCALSLAVLLTRALVAALADISDAIREKK